MNTPHPEHTDSLHDRPEIVGSRRGLVPRWRRRPSGVPPLPSTSGLPNRVRNDGEGEEPAKSHDLGRHPVQSQRTCDPHRKQIAGLLQPHRSTSRRSPEGRRMTISERIYQMAAGHLETPRDRWHTCQALGLVRRAVRPSAMGTRSDHPRIPRCGGHHRQTVPRHGHRHPRLAQSPVGCPQSPRSYQGRDVPYCRTPCLDGRHELRNRRTRLPRRPRLRRNRGRKQRPSPQSSPLTLTKMPNRSSPSHSKPGPHSNAHPIPSSRFALSPISVTSSEPSTTFVSAPAPERQAHLPLGVAS